MKLAGYYWGTRNEGEEGNFKTQNDGDVLSAAKTWGNDGIHFWTLPSVAQWQALIKYCSWSWTDNYNETGRTGIVVTGKEENFENGNSIFLPAEGCYSGTLKTVQQAGSLGYYSTSDIQYNCRFNKTYFNINPHTNLSDGLSVRPVAE